MVLEKQTNLIALGSTVHYLLSGFVLSMLAIKIYFEIHWTMFPPFDNSLLCCKVKLQSLWELFQTCLDK